MKRRLIVPILMIVLCVAYPARAADESDTAQSIIGGTIPELCQIGIVNTGLATLLTLNQDGNGEISYDQGYVESAADAAVLTLDANEQWQLGGSVGAWTCPGTYDKDENDLLVQITNTPTGTIQNSFDSYQTLSGSNTAMLLHTVGVSNNIVNIQARVLLDWTVDIPGTYSITVTWTMETTSI